MYHHVFYEIYLINCGMFASAQLHQGGIHVLLLIEKRNYKQFASFLLIVDCLSLCVCIFHVFVFDIVSDNHPIKQLCSIA